MLAEISSLDRLSNSTARMNYFSRTHAKITINDLYGALQELDL